MDKADLKNFCFYYKGQTEPPSELNRKEAKLWKAEEQCCTTFADNIISSDNPEREFKRFIVEYVQKWDFFWSDTLELYRQMDPKYLEDLF